MTILSGINVKTKANIKTKANAVYHLEEANDLIEKAISELNNTESTLTKLASKVGQSWKDIINWNGGVADLIRGFNQDEYEAESGNAREAEAMNDFVEFVDENRDTIYLLLDNKNISDELSKVTKVLEKCK